MKFNCKQFADIVAQAKLNKSEVAQLYGVSRQTVYDWLKGAPPRAGSLHERMAVSITAALAAAIAKGALPIRAVDVNVRRKRIGIMQRALQDLKPARPQ